MKKSKLKPLIKAVLLELYKRKINEGSGTLDEFEIEFEGLIIPGLSTDDDLVYVKINIDYESTPDISARGMWGPPEKSSSAESGDFSITGHSIGSVTIKSGAEKPRELDIKELNSEQLKVIKQAVNEYLQSNEDEIRDRVQDSEGSSELYYPNKRYDNF